MLLASVPIGGRRGAQFRVDVLVGKGSRSQSDRLKGGDMNSFTRMLVVGLFCLAGASPAGAALYEPNPANFGTPLATVSNCDDCFEGPFAFPGGQSLNFFGTAYTGLFVGSNGYVTFGSGATGFSSQPLDVQTLGPMIAGVFTDLDTRNDATSQVFVNSATPGQLIVTFVGMGHFSQNYTVRSTFQLVVRSDQFVVPQGEGTVGFFYDSVTDTNTASAGFGDGLAAVNPGEQAFFSGPATGLNNSAPRWFTIAGGIPGGGGPPPVSVAIIPVDHPLALGLLLAFVSLVGAIAILRRA